MPLDADLVFDVRCLANPHYEPKLQPLTGRDLPVVAFLEKEPAVERMYGDIERFVATLASRVRPRQPQLPHRRDRLHGRPAPLGVPGRAPRQGVLGAQPGPDPAPGARLSARGAIATA